MKKNQKNTKSNLSAGSIPKLRFPEFQNSSEWVEKKLGEIGNVIASGDLELKYFSPIYTKTHIYPVYSNSVTQEGLYGYYSHPKYEKGSVTITARGTLGVAFARNHDFMGIGRLLVISNIKVDELKLHKKGLLQQLFPSGEET